MTENEIIDAIEQGDVLCDLLLATGAAGLQSRLERSAVLGEALNMIQADESFYERCIARATEVAQREALNGYAHPDRTAVAAYAYLMFNSDRPRGLTLIRDWAIQNRSDWLDVTDLVRVYAWHRPALEIQKLSEPNTFSVHLNSSFCGPEIKQGSRELAESANLTFTVSCPSYALAV